MLQVPLNRNPLTLHLTLCRQAPLQRHKLSLQVRPHHQQLLSPVQRPPLLPAMPRQLRPQPPILHPQVRATSSIWLLSQHTSISCLLCPCLDALPPAKTCMTCGIKASTSCLPPRKPACSVQSTVCAGDAISAAIAAASAQSASQAAAQAASEARAAGATSAADAATQASAMASAAATVGTPSHGGTQYSG